MTMTFRQGTEEYYQKFIELQDKLRKSEEERLVLEMKFNEMMQVTREEEQAYYKKLRSQYKQFLEENRKRQERNERLLRLLERVESRASMLEAKTQRIQFLRKQYHNYLDRISAKNRIKAEHNNNLKRSREQQQSSFNVEPSSHLPSNQDQSTSVNAYHPNMLPQNQHFSQKQQSTTYYNNPYSEPVNQLNPVADNRSYYHQNASQIAEDIMSSIRNRRRVNAHLDSDSDSVAGVSSYKRNVSFDSDESRQRKLGVFGRPEENQRMVGGTSVNYFNDNGYGQRNSGEARMYGDNSAVKNVKEDEYGRRHLNDTQMYGVGKSNQSNDYYGNPVTPNEMQMYGNRNEAGRNCINNYDYTTNQMLTGGGNEGLPSNYGSEKNGRTRDFENVNNDYGRKHNLDNINNGFRKRAGLDDIGNIGNDHPRQSISGETQNVVGENYNQHNLPVNILINNSEHENQIITNGIHKNLNKSMRGLSLDDIKEQTSYVDNNLSNNENQLKSNSSEGNNHGLDSSQNTNLEGIHDGKSVTSTEEMINQTSSVGIEFVNSQADKNVKQLDQTLQNVEYQQEINAKQQQSNQGDPTPRSDFTENVQTSKADANKEQSDRNVAIESDAQSIKTIPTQVIDPNNEVTPTEQFDSKNQPIEYDQNEQQMQYDSNNLPIKTAENDQTPLYDSNNCTMQLDELGQQINVEQNKQSVQFDESGQPITNQDIQYEESGQQINNQKIEYDESGQIQYDENGQQIKYDETGQPNNEQIQYDESGQAMNIQQVQYDQNGQPIGYDLNNQQITYDENGQPIHYDEKGQPLQFDPNGQPIQYDDNGQLLENTQTIQFDANGQPVQYDEQQLTVQPVQFDENGQPIRSTESIQYDENGQPLQFDENGQVIQNIQAIQYDENGQPIQYDDNGQVMQNTQAIEYDENGQPIQFDDNGQVIQNTQPIQHDENGQPIQYDENAQPIQFDTNGQPIQYDEHGQLIQYDQNGQPIQYDENGQAIQYDENGQVIQYDENGQPINFDPNVQYNYDENGQLIQYDENGQIISYNAESSQEVTDPSNVTFNENGEEKKQNVLDLLETDTESGKQDTNKVSNDSDFDFSNAT